MIRTRVGYAGGTTPNPTYSNIGDHSETVQIEYDPAKISYDQLLQIFWHSHSPIFPVQGQYASLIFYHNSEQEKLALESKAREGAGLKSDIYTRIVPYSGFTIAEQYHQKYDLQQNERLMAEFGLVYPSFDDFVNSTAVARVNGYLGNNGSCPNLKSELGKLGLSKAGEKILLKIVCGENSEEAQSEACPVPNTN